MITETVKITSKGQITIPKEIRKRLQSTAVFFEVVNEDIVVRPVKDAAGSLSAYAKNAEPSLSGPSMKEQAWEEGVHEKFGKTPS